MLSENFYQALAGEKLIKKRKAEKEKKKKIKWKDELKLEIIEK